MCAAGKGKNAETPPVPTELDESLVREALDIVDESVRATMAMRKPFIVAEISRRLSNSEGVQRVTPGKSDESWSDIESLSRLRGMVGGRFQNLRDRWIAAGFPLKEHRGEKAEPVDVDQDGWIELSNWIMKQGFECRLTPGKSGCLFQLRKVG